MSEKTRTELKEFFETGDRPTQAQFWDLIDSTVNKTDDAVPQRLRIKISQSESDEPAVTIFHDDFGGAYTISRSAPGEFTIVAAAGTFPLGKTFISGGTNDTDNQCVGRIFHSVDTTILIQAISTGTESPADGIMKNQYFEIIVDP